MDSIDLAAWKSKGILVDFWRPKSGEVLREARSEASLGRCRSSHWRASSGSQLALPIVAHHKLLAEQRADDWVPGRSRIVSG